MNNSKIVLGLILQLCVAYVTTIYGSACQTCPKMPGTLDYYWRDYVGIIPEDAIEGGTDESGRPTYVGQAYFVNAGVLPSTIFSGSRKAHSNAYFVEVTTDKNIKILCSKHKENFEWIQTKADETHLLIDSHIVDGGFEVGTSLNIGRVRYDGKVSLGKVFGYHSAFKGLWILHNGVAVNFQSYEILTYNTNKAFVPEIIYKIESRYSQ